MPYKLNSSVFMTLSNYTSYFFFVLRKPIFNFIFIHSLCINFFLFFILQLLWTSYTLFYFPSCFAARAVNRTTTENQCFCDKNSTESFEYDNILKRPICKPQTEVVPESKCRLHFVNSTDFSSVRKAVRIYRLPVATTRKCLCDIKNNEEYRGLFCIRNELFKDLKHYQQYRHLPLTQTLNLSYELKFIVLFCKILHRRDYCNYLANLCVLTHYKLDKNGPCYSFYQQQNQHLAIDEGGNMFGASEGNEFDGGEKMKPFLFFRGRKNNKHLFDKFIDFSYNIENVSLSGAGEGNFSVS